MERCDLTASLIDDRGTTVTLVLNGVNYGNIDARGLTPVRPGYMVLIGGDRAAGDYFDNIVVQK